MTRPAYPLQWPETWTRTAAALRKEGRFRTPILAACTSIRNDLRRMGGTRVVISTNMPTRRDGNPYATGRAPEDPGAAVWWRNRRGLEAAIACDRWRDVADNLQAIALSIAALRGLQRWGAPGMVERAFDGFARALPPGSATGTDQILDPEGGG